MKSSSNFLWGRWAMGLVALLTFLLMACGGAEEPKATTAPIQEVDTKAPVQTGDTKAPAQTGDTKAPADTAVPKATEEPTTAAKPGKDTVTLVTRGEPATMNAWIPGCTASEDSLACSHIGSEPLVWITADASEVVPLSGVEGWESIAPDRWRFRLREGVKFHNGEPWDAAAAKVGIDYLGDTETAGHSSNAYNQHGPISAEIVDDFTVDVVCGAKCPIFLRAAQRTEFTAPKWFDTASEEDRAQNTYGYGPYKLVEWQRGIKVEMEIYKDYKPNDAFASQAPTIQHVIQVWRLEPTVRAAMVETGEADWATTIGFDNRDKVPKAIVNTNNRTLFLELDKIWHPELKKQKVRRALALAIDCENIVEFIYAGAIECHGAISPRGTVGITPENSVPYPFDPELAKQLLQEAGYDPANVIRLYSRPDGNAYRGVEVWEAVVTMWNDVGVNAELKILENSLVRKRQRSGCGRYSPNSRDCVNQPPPEPWSQVRHVGPSSSSNRLMDFSKHLNQRANCGNGGSHSCDPSPGGFQDRFDAFLEITDLELRREAMEALQVTLHEEVWFIPFFELVVTYGMATDLEWEPRYDSRIRVNNMRFIP